MRVVMAFCARSFAVPRWLSLALALAASPAALVMVDTGEAFAQLPHVEYFNDLTGFVAAIRARLSSIANKKYCRERDTAKVAVVLEWLEWEKKYAGNIVAPRGSAAETTLSNLDDAIAAQIARLKKPLPHCSKFPSKKTRAPEVKHKPGHKPPGWITRPG